MLDHGFRTDLQGVAMQRLNEPGYNRAGVYLIDDWSSADANVTAARSGRAISLSWSFTFCERLLLPFV
jgi:hypothetical protein